MYILQHNTVLKEPLSTNSLIVANKRAKMPGDLVARADPNNIKTDTLDQTDHGYNKYGRNCDSLNHFVLQKHLL